MSQSLTGHDIALTGPISMKMRPKTNKASLQGWDYRDEASSMTVLLLLLAATHVNYINTASCHYASIRPHLLFMSLLPFCSTALNWMMTTTRMCRFPWQLVKQVAKQPRHQGWPFSSGQRHLSVEMKSDNGNRLAVNIPYGIKCQGFCHHCQVSGNEKAVSWMHNFYSNES